MEAVTKAGRDIPPEVTHRAFTSPLPSQRPGVTLGGGPVAG